MKQIIYPQYAATIFVTSIIFAFTSLTFGNTVDKNFPKFDKHKTKNVILLEISIQIGILATFAYVYRSVIGYAIRHQFKIYGKPDTFATLVVAPTMFSQQTELMKKIKYIWN